MKGNPHEARKRTAKALRPAHILIAHGATAAMAAALPPEGRSMAAKLAGVRPPSEATWAVVEQLLHDRESPRPLVPVNTEAFCRVSASHDRRRPESQTYSADEVAAIFGISRTLVYEQVRRGVFPARAMRFGKLVRVARADVQRDLMGTNHLASDQEPDA